MSWTDWVCLSVVLLGFALFLYGANFFNAITGWIGAYLFFGGLLFFIVIYIYRELTKKQEVQKP